MSDPPSDVNPSATINQQPLPRSGSGRPRPRGLTLRLVQDDTAALRPENHATGGLEKKVQSLVECSKSNQSQAGRAGDKQ